MQDILLTTHPFLANSAVPPPLLSDRGQWLRVTSPLMLVKDEVKYEHSTFTALLNGVKRASKYADSLQTVQPFKYVKSGYFSMTNESRER